MGKISSLCIILLIIVGCREPEESTTSGFEAHARPPIPCQAVSFRFPTTAFEFQRLYRDRSFYADGNHLGMDLDLRSASTIHPIACGIIREYRPSTEYGTLVVVIEHELFEIAHVLNGENHRMPVKRFLSIYGQLRTEWYMDVKPLDWKVGDRVSPNDVIGYVQAGDKNNHGAPHLHFGIRLQTLSDAEATDSNWLRGYDTTPSQRKWFADPSSFLSQMMIQSAHVTWHPPGTILSRRDLPDHRWVIDGDMRRHWFTSSEAHRLSEFAVLATEEELACYEVGGVYHSIARKPRIIMFDGSGTLYMTSENNPATRRHFIEEETLRSWGWNANDIEKLSTSAWDAFAAHYVDDGRLLPRDGTLVKVIGSNELAILSGGWKFPFFDWKTFETMGFDPVNIIEMEAGELETMGYVTGPVISPERISSCAIREQCNDAFCYAD